MRNGASHPIILLLECLPAMGESRLESEISSGFGRHSSAQCGAALSHFLMPTELKQIILHVYQDYQVLELNYLKNAFTHVGF